MRARSPATGCFQLATHAFRETSPGASLDGSIRKLSGISCPAKHTTVPRLFRGQLNVTPIDRPLDRTSLSLSLETAAPWLLSLSDKMPPRGGETAAKETRLRGNRARVSACTCRCTRVHATTAGSTRCAAKLPLFFTRFEVCAACAEIRLFLLCKLCIFCYFILLRTVFIAGTRVQCVLLHFVVLHCVLVRYAGLCFPMFWSIYSAPFYSILFSPGLLDLTQFYFILNCAILDFIRFCCILFWWTLLCSVPTLSYCVLFWFTLFHSILLCSTEFHCVLLFQSVLPCFTLFYSVLLCSTLFYSILISFIIFYTLLFYSMYFTLFFTALLYFVVLSSFIFHFTYCILLYLVRYTQSDTKACVPSVYMIIIF